MNKNNDVTLDDLARMVADGFEQNRGRFDKIEQILATVANTLVGVQTELRELREVVILNHEQRISKLEDKVLQ